MTHLLLWGNAYAQIIRNGKGEVVALYPLMPNRMTVNRDENGELYYEYQTSQDEAHTMNGSRVRLQPSDVLHVLCHCNRSCRLQPDCNGKERHRHGNSLRRIRR